ncbi:MAG: gliding motility-associated C-terminal domain-containing protein, partial [Flavobacteriales bacterium]|nr:gliding motility-associated C-terminal domain-containing protein [Flavobacteriales bacterium]
VQIDVTTVTGDSTIIEGCAGAVLNFTRPDTSGSYTVFFNIGGNAINGVDYNPIADSVTFQPGFDTTSLTIIPILDALAEGQETIIITVFTINACGDTNISIGIIYILDLPDMLTFAPDTTLQCPLSTLPISASASGAAPPFTYSWTNSQGNPIGNTSTILVQGLQTDTFYVSITDSCNLITITDTVILTLAIPPLTLTVPNDTLICPGDQVIITAFGGGGQPGYTYQWNPGGINDSTIIVNPLVTTSYVVQMIDVCNTITMFDTVVVNANYTPMTVTIPLVESVCVGIPMEISSVINDGRPNYSYSWSDGTNVFNGNPFFYPTDNPALLTLNLVVTDLCGNQAIGAIDIEVIACAVVVPNVITPNGDGMNDFLVFENLEYFPNNHLVVYNRWGQNLFETDNYQNNWDGDNLSDGTYFFILELNNSNNTMHKGTFTLFK